MDGCFGNGLVLCDGGGGGMDGGGFTVGTRSTHAGTKMHSRGAPEQAARFNNRTRN